MITWILENLATIIISVLLIAAIAGVFIHLRRNKKKGKSSCGCGCGSCPISDDCHDDCHDDK